MSNLMILIARSNEKMISGMIHNQELTSLIFFFFSKNLIIKTIIREMSAAKIAITPIITHPRPAHPSLIVRA